MAKSEIVTLDNAAFDIARRKAIYGHKTWLVYRRQDGSHVARLYDAEAIKAAMLATGTQGKFWWMSANTGTGNICQSWRYATRLWRCARGWERRGFSTA